MFIHSKNFRGLFWTQTFGAFVDNFYKSFLMVWIVYHLPESQEHNSKLLITISSALFIIPFFLFSSIAGELAAKYEKTTLIRLTKWWELGLVILAIVSFRFESLYWMMAILFLLGTQSAFFGPMKYSILPQIIDKNLLLKANGWVEMGTFIAILVGTLLGSLVLSIQHEFYYFEVFILIATLSGLFLSYQIPSTTCENPNQTIHPNFIGRTFHQMQELTKDKSMFWIIQMISWFWFLGIVILTLIPIISKDYLHQGEKTVSHLLTSMSLMIGIGSVACHSISKKITPIKISVYSAFFVTFFIFTLAWSNTVTSFLIHLSLFSFFCGLYAVPLYTYLQKEQSIFLKSHLIAMLNIFNSLWMVLASILLTYLLQKVSLGTIFILLGSTSFIQSIFFYFKHKSLD